MKLTNTSHFPTEFVREVIRFVRPPGISKFRVQVTRCSHWGGWYTWGGRVTVRVPEAAHRPYPIHFPARRGYLATVIFTPEEGLVLYLAHELRHVWQHMHPKGGRVWGARGRYSERDADAYAIQRVRRWRRR